MPPFFVRIYHFQLLSISHYKNRFKRYFLATFCSIMEILNIIYPLKMGINHKNNLFKHIIKIMWLAAAAAKKPEFV